MDTPSQTRLARAYAEIDRANSADPNRIESAGKSRPAELVYGERMTDMLARLHPEASEVLRIAVRAQHLRRWEVPRSSYPMDRAGYLRWRTDLKARHAEHASEILGGLGFSAEEIARVAGLIRKENLKRDPEAQALEDVAALVFLEFYAADFAPKHEPEKVIAILKKTFAKMSEAGRKAAVALPLPAPLAALVRDLAT